MRRVVFPPRPDWKAKAEALGFTYHSLSGSGAEAYWQDDAAYKFQSADIEAICSATETLHGLCIQAVDHIVRHPALMARFGVPRDYTSYLIRSWEQGAPSLMGRFDLAFDPETRRITMLEYNADTATLAIETALMQRDWLGQRQAELCVQGIAASQCNALQASLIAALARMKAEQAIDSPMHFTALDDTPEERQHGLFMAGLARQAGIDARYLPVTAIGRHWRRGFVDETGTPIRWLHKFYPWEWMAADPFGAYMPRSAITVLEPIWKMLLSSKAILPLLWELFPGHPNLLPAAWTVDAVGDAYVAKPVRGREGANIRLVRPGQAPIVTGGSYGQIADRVSKRRRSSAL